MAWVKKYKKDGYTEDGWMEVPDDQVSSHSGDWANAQQKQQEWMDQSRSRWGLADKMAYGAAAVPFGAAAISALAGGAPAASASVPGAVGAESAPLGVGTVSAAGAPGSIATGVGASGGAAAGGGAAAANGIQKLLGGMTARDWAALAASGIGTVGGLMSNKPMTAPTSATTDPNMQKLIASMQGRLDASDPLFKSVMAMANGLLPTQYQNGGQGR